MKTIGKLICLLKRKHLRGKLVGYTTDPQQPKIKIFQCPRCGNQTTYKVKPAPSQNQGTAGDQA